VRNSSPAGCCHPSTDRRIAKDRTGPDLDDRLLSISMSPNRAIPSDRSDFSFPHAVAQPRGETSVHLGTGQQYVPLGTPNSQCPPRHPSYSFRQLPTRPLSLLERTGQSSSGSRRCPSLAVGRVVFARANLAAPVCLGQLGGSRQCFRFAVLAWR
jgi:hypothetical protein